MHRVPFASATLSRLAHQTYPRLSPATTTLGAQLLTSCEQPKRWYCASEPCYKQRRSGSGDRRQGGESTSGQEQTFGDWLKKRGAEVQQQKQHSQQKQTPRSSSAEDESIEAFIKKLQDNPEGM